MPLIHSNSKQAFSENVSNLMHEVGKSPHVKSRDQALAIAYQIKRDQRAAGGRVHAGPINSMVPGRTDNHAMSVAPGAYVLPADHVSSIGQGNTAAGMNVLNNMFGPSGPYGIGKSPSIRKGAGVPKPPGIKTARAEGGVTGNDDAPVDIMAAGGEFVIPPEVVAEIGGGNIKHGHQILDQWVVANRKKHISILRKLPGPAKS